MAVKINATDRQSGMKLTVGRSYGSIDSAAELATDRKPIHYAKMSGVAFRVLRRRYVGADYDGVSETPSPMKAVVTARRKSTARAQRAFVI